MLKHILSQGNQFYSMVSGAGCSEMIEDIVSNAAMHHSLKDQNIG